MQPDEIVRRILEARGVAGETGVREFLSVKPRLVHDPLLIPQMEAAVDFLVIKLKNSDHICVYGDYDVDGMLGTAIMVLFLQDAARRLGSAAERVGGASKISYYIPSRIEEGYGLNNAAIAAIAETGAGVIVTVDCGSVSAAEAAYAKSIGLDILITDHHDLNPDALPDALLINPNASRTSESEFVGNEKDSVYPFDMLSGAGVAFKLCTAMQRRLGFEPDLLRSLIDLVCVATVADVMPLVDENRTIVKYGLTKLRKGTRPAFRELFRVSGIEASKADVRDIAFGIAPRLNAIGRLGDASEGVELFLTEDLKRMREIAERMDRLNSERKSIQDECLRDCMDLCSIELHEDVPRFLLLRPEHSHEGVAGIVASNVREATGLPCAVLTEAHETNGKSLLKGSARSAGRLDLIALLRRHDELFERLGGHAAAAGFMIREENEAILREALCADLFEMLEDDPGLLDERPESELEIELGDVTYELAKKLLEIAPFGQGNPKPALSLRLDTGKIEGVRHMGQDGKHLRFSSGGVTFVFFSGAGTDFPEKRAIEIIGCPEINHWNGRSEIQFAVRSIDLV